MGSSIFPGSEVLVRGGTRPHPGEVWVFYDSEGRLVVHRHLWTVGHVLRFQGDLRMYPDPGIVSDQLVGRVRAVRKNGAVTVITARAQLAGWLTIAARAARLRLAKVDPRGRARGS
jgi:hypothetical protein